MARCLFTASYILYAGRLLRAIYLPLHNTTFVIYIYAYIWPDDGRREARNPDDADDELRPRSMLHACDLASADT